MPAFEVEGAELRVLRAPVPQQEVAVEALVHVPVAVRERVVVAAALAREPEGAVVPVRERVAAVALVREPEEAAEALVPERERAVVAALAREPEEAVEEALVLEREGAEALSPERAWAEEEVGAAVVAASEEPWV